MNVLSETAVPVRQQGVEVDRRVDLGAFPHLGEPHGIMIVVSGVQFVGRRPRNRHLVPGLVDGLGQKGMDVVADCRDRSVVIGDQIVHAREETFGRSMDGCVAAAQGLDHQLDVPAFVIALVPVDDREAVDVMAQLFRCDGGQGRGIDPAGKTKGERDIGAEAQADGIEQSGPGALHGLFRRHGTGDVAQLPIKLRHFQGGGIERQVGRGRQFEHAVEEGIALAVEGPKAIGQIAQDLGLVNRWAAPGQGDQGLDLRGEIQRPVLRPKIQGLFAEPVAAQRQGPGPAVGQREGPHAFQLVQTGGAPPSPSGKKYFRVGGGQKTLAQGFQFGS